MRRSATYRLQLRPEFGFREAMGVLPYLRDLGITHVYCSPYFQAARGSAHGYDVTDPGRIDAELGGAGAHADFCALLRELELEQVLDIVPNHMCVTDAGNWRWWDVLAGGRQSRWAGWFDIDWESSDRILAPILGDPIDAVLERGELTLELQDGAAVVRYFDSVLPLAQGTAPPPGELERPWAVPALRDLLDRQHYRLAFWREAAGRINYRRFFDINSLAGVRVEDPRVFEDTQRLAIELVTSGKVDALRIDHIDGLREPREYLQRLRDGIGNTPWLLVEKILDRGEQLPATWPVEGTTGYEFGAVAGGLFVDPAGRYGLGSLLAGVSGQRRDVRSVVDECKRLVCDRIFPADIKRVAERLLAASAAREGSGNRTLEQCAAVVTALLVAMPVYRTYAARNAGELSEQDRRALSVTMRRAQKAAPDLDAGLLGLAGVLIDGGARSDAELDFVFRLQQTGAAVTAKGVEDTAFYRCVSLASIDEVGDSPLHWGTSIDDFHRHNELAAEQSPLALLATSTHDTKRSEDVRMRLHVLSEFAGLWADRARHWSSRNAQHKVAGNPDGADELLLYQTLLGAHPLSAGRAASYMEKATREAKRRTSWTDPDPAYDAAVQAFTLAVAGDAAFSAEMRDFVAPLVTLGRVNSLALTLLKLTAPGVPDIYQGCELWDLSLVDPDNRRPVDYDARREALARAADEATISAWNSDCGAAKLALIHRALALRRRRTDSFGPGSDYRPMHAGGERAEHAVAFARGEDVISVAPRLVGRLNGWTARYQPVWDDTWLRLPAGRWRDVMAAGAHTGDVLLRDLLSRFPVALLERGGP